MPVQTAVRELHKVERDYVEIVLAKDGPFGWVARLRFVEQDFDWEERSLTADKALGRALEFFREAYPDHACSQECKRFTAEGEQTLGDTP